MDDPLLEVFADGVKLCGGECQRHVLDGVAVCFPLCLEKLRKCFPVIRDVVLVGPFDRVLQKEVV